jgi:enamine deaminase RidA (YjgF/YER057c/UK114 family)
MSRTLISSGGRWEEMAGYSRAVRVGDVVEVSGTTDAGPDGISMHPDDAEAQAREALSRIATALAQAGATVQDLVRTRIYVARIEDWQAVLRAHAEVFAQVRPAATLVQVAALIHPSLLVEIEATAVVGSAG